MKKSVLTIIIGILIGTISTVLASSLLASDITYKPKDKAWGVTNVQAAIDSLKLAKTSDNYSTDERVIGTWIDGKPLYQKTFVLSLSDFSTTLHSGWYVYLIDSSDMVMLDLAHSYIETEAGTQYMMLPYSDSSNGQMGFQTVKKNNKGGFMFNGNRVSNISNGYVFTAQYTKTTD